MGGIENGWYYSKPIDAYQSDIEGELLMHGGIVAEHVNIGDWIFRFGNGIVACTTAEAFSMHCDLDSARPIPQEPE